MNNKYYCRFVLSCIDKELSEIFSKIKFENICTITEVSTIIGIIYVQNFCLNLNYLTYTFIILYVVNFLLWIVSVVLFLFLVYLIILVLIFRFIDYLFSISVEDFLLLNQIKITDTLTDDICSICQDKLDESYIVTKCLHKYHLACCIKWVNNNLSCPVCRTKFLTK